MLYTKNVYNIQATPFFSIITVCLNAGDSLNKTINSVLIQKFTNFEIIIKDGFSTDGTFENISNNHKILKYQEKDSGIYNAMNQALNLAKGQYVLFLNAGDFFYDDNVLNVFYDEIVRNNYPSLIYCDYITTGLGVYVQSPAKLSNFFLFRTMLCHQVCMINRKSYESIGNFNLSFKVDADYDFLLRLILIGKASYKHIKMLGVISTSNGFSFHNHDIAKKEVDIIRRKYFKNNFLFYSIALKLTLPAIRRKMSSNSGLVSKLYQRVVNVINYTF